MYNRLAGERKITSRDDGVLTRLKKRHARVTSRLIEKHAAARKFLQMEDLLGRG